MEKLKDKVNNIVKDFATSLDEDIEMLNTNGVILKFENGTPEETVRWLCRLIENPGNYKKYF